MFDIGFTSWLLAARTPSIRYLTLRRLLGRPEDDADVQAARRDMAASGPIQQRRSRISSCSQSQVMLHSAKIRFEQALLGGQAADIKGGNRP